MKLVLEINKYKNKYLFNYLSIILYISQDYYVLSC